MSISIAELDKALKSLKESLDLYKSSSKGQDVIRKAFRDACIQRFEYCIELAWKTSMKYLGSNTTAAKPAIREMARSDLISDPELWFRFIDARNDSSHSYNEEVAVRVFQKIEEFYPEAEKLVTQLLKAYA